MERRMNPNSGKFIKPTDFKDLGWQIHSGSSPDLAACIKAEHKRREFDNSLYMNRCTDVVTICDECKFVYHTDMSD